MLDKNSFFSLLDQSFPGLRANIEHCEKIGFPWASRPFLKMDKGEVVAHVGFLEYPMIVDKREVRAGALHAICTKKTYRGHGLATELIQEALHWAKDHYEHVVLFTEVPKFYERLSFHAIQEYRFKLSRRNPRGKQVLRPVISPNDDALFIRLYKERQPLSHQVWMRDDGTIASFNTLFATYPKYWSLYYSPSIEGFLSFEMKDGALHLYDVIASKIPSFEVILDHMPQEIEEIYFYFVPDHLTKEATAEPLIYDNGFFMVHGNWPYKKPFMIPPLSRC